MAEPVLAFEEATFRSEEGKASFSGLNWSLARGGLVKLARGPETSALFRLAAGAAHPQEGLVLLDGVPLGPYTFDHPFLSRGALGWVPREGGLLVNQSLLMNIALPLMFVRRMRRSAAESLAAEALGRAGLADAAEHRPHILDPRERWLGALVRAAVREPELWLLELPPTSLSHRMREAAAAILERAASPTALIAGDENWIPWTACQTLRWDDGRLIPGET